MLYLYESQRLEVLADLLVERLAEWASEGLLDPLLPEMVIPQNPVIGRWFSVHLSERTGISANLSFPLAGRLIRDLLDPAFGDPLHPVHFEKETLVLRIFDLLPPLLQNPSFFVVRGFLGREAAESRRYDLSVLLADLYDRSMIYRPDLLLEWEEGRDPDGWPAILWRALSGPLRPFHRARLMDRFFHTRGRALAGRLPARITLFGLTGMAPRDLQFFRVLGEEELCEIHLFFLNPCEEYWGDIVTSRVLERASLEKASYLTTGSPLLSSWGEQFRVIHHLLSDLPQSIRIFPPSSGTLLGRVQEDIRTLVDRGALVRKRDVERQEVPEEDRSIEVVRCPSPVREIEMLKDRLLDLFSEIPGLRPEEIVVLAPDIGKYAGIVRSVFTVPGEEGGEREKEPGIPFVISDRRDLLEDPVFEALLLILRIPGSRLTAPVVVRLLSVASVARCFGLAHLHPSRLQEILRNSGFRWGRHGSDRPAPYSGVEEHTLAEGRDRLLLGYACGEELPAGERDRLRPDPLFLPEDQEGEIAGAIASVLDALDALSEDLSSPVSADRWPERVSRILDAFFDLDPTDGMASDILALPDRLSRGFSEAGVKGTLTAGLVAHHLERMAGTGEGRDRFFSGGVTFGRMVPLRSIPFRVVCLVGMNDADFPRISWPPSFDWLAADPEPGDRSLREDDRTLFLEALLSARDCLWISFVGIEIRDGSPREPSVLVRQLMDHLSEGFTGRDQPIARQISLEAPIDPLSPSHYSEEADRRLRSYSRSWHTALSASRRPPEKERIFYDPSLAWKGGGVRNLPSSSGSLPLSELRSFFRDPVRFFLTRRMGLPLSDRTLILEENEPFIPDDTVLLSRLLRRSGPAQADLPWPPLRRMAEEKARWEREEYCRDLENRTGIKCPPSHSDPPLAMVEARFRGLRVYGPLEGLYETREGGRLLLVERWPWDAGPSHFLETSLLHLVGSLFIPDYRGAVLTGRGAKKKSIGPGRHPIGLWRWRPLSPSEASRAFVTYLRAFRKGGDAPLPFDPEASEVFVSILDEANGPGEGQGESLRQKALDRARATLRSARRPSFYGKDGFFDPRKASSYWSSLAFSGRDLPSEPAFALWSVRLFRPIREGCVEEGGG